MQNNHEDEKVLVKDAVEGSFWYGTSTIIQKIGGLFFTVILARFLLPEGFGLYNLAISIVAITFIFAQSASDNTLARYISATFRDKNKASSTFKFIFFALKLIPLLISLSVLLILSYPLSNGFLKKPILFFPLLLTAIFFFFTSLEQFFTYLFIAIKKVKYKTQKEILFQLLRISLILILFLIIIKKPSLNYALIILIISAFAAFLFVFYKTYYISPHLFWKSEPLPKEERKKILQFFKYLSFISVSVVLLGHIDTIILGYLVPDVSAIGLYKSALFIVSSVASLISLSAVFIPFFVQTGGKELHKIFNKIIKYLMIIAIPSAFGIGILANYFLVLIYGKEYAGATLALYFLAPIIVFSTLVALFRDLFSAREQPKNVLAVITPVMILNVLLNYFLISFFLKYSSELAVAGAAIAMLLSWLIYAAGLIILSRKNLNIKINLPDFIKPIFASLIMIFVLIYLKNVLSHISLISGAILTLSGIVSYFVTLILIKGITKEDYFVIRLYKDKIKKIFRKPV